MRAVTALDERECVPAEHITWQLDHWLTSARRPLLEMYEALGGILPWNASSLDRARQDARVRDRLVQALERRELVALRVQRRAAAWAWPEPALPPPGPSPRSSPGAPARGGLHPLPRPGTAGRGPAPGRGGGCAVLRGV
ncbi:hypothetical protein QEG98_22245 [Myxococcus sp. MxC21-1]|uniref:hypothetical protein n=1 Tax=Myxococcus sp. MxC21-1 TaxID=3041439 RepID=UPI0029306E76|nr:hypothetical protein [Myxococcus sp. MxC21-1]WNZ58861.1 hypothetical protein QEG98_22245 [Myxococcus sp. MxC21-1]